MSRKRHRGANAFLMGRYGLKRTHPEELVLIGGGAHSLCLLDILSSLGAQSRVLGYVDRQPSSLPLTYLGDEESFSGRYSPSNATLLMGIGTDIRLREKLFQLYKGWGFIFESLVSPGAHVSNTASMGEGCVVFPGAVLGAMAQLEENVVLHSNTVVEHQSHIGAHSYLAPGAVVPGISHIGKRVLLGPNSAMLDHLSLADDCVLGAGAVLTKSFSQPGKTLVGIPAREHQS